MKNEVQLSLAGSSICATMIVGLMTYYGIGVTAEEALSELMQSLRIAKSNIPSTSEISNWIRLFN